MMNDDVDDVRYVQDGWKPVAEEPLDNAPYLVVVRHSDGAMTHDIKHWHNGKVRPGLPAQWHGGMLVGWEVTHWQPLPQLPENEDMVSTFVRR